MFSGVSDWSRGSRRCGRTKPMTVPPLTPPPAKDRFAPRPSGHGQAMRNDVSGLVIRGVRPNSRPSRSRRVQQAGARDRRAGRLTQRSSAATGRPQMRESVARCRVPGLIAAQVGPGSCRRRVRTSRRAIRHESPRQDCGHCPSSTPCFVSQDRTRHAPIEVSKLMEHWRACCPPNAQGRLSLGLLIEFGAG